jgi:hypothetical protein
MKTSVLDRDLRRMEPGERARVVAKLAADAFDRPNGELVALNAQLAQLERRHGKTSAEMRADLESGRVPETMEICEWMQLLEIKEYLAGSPRE